MKERCVALLVCALLASCSRAVNVPPKDAIVCDLQGRAWKLQVWVGDTSFVSRLEEADGLCARLKP